MISKEEKTPREIVEALIERISRFVEMVGVVALVQAVVMPSHPQIGWAIAYILSCLAGLYFAVPLAERLVRVIAGLRSWQWWAAAIVAATAISQPIYGLTIWLSDLISANLGV